MRASLLRLKLSPIPKIFRRPSLFEVSKEGFGEGFKAPMTRTPPSTTANFHRSFLMFVLSLLKGEKTNIRKERKEGNFARRAFESRRKRVSKHLPRGCFFISEIKLLILLLKSTPTKEISREDNSIRLIESFPRCTEP